MKYGIMAKVRTEYAIGKGRAKNMSVGYHPIKTMEEYKKMTKHDLLMSIRALKAANTKLRSICVDMQLENMYFKRKYTGMKSLNRIRK